MKSMISRILWVSFLAFFVVGFLSGAVSAKVDVEFEVRLSEENIDTGDSFSVDAIITNVDADENLSSNQNIDFVIYVDNVIVYEDVEHAEIEYNESETITVRSTNFNSEWDDDEGRLLAYVCGEVDVSVHVSDDVSGESDSGELTLEGDELTVGMDPQSPTSGSDIVITVEDKLGKELDDIKVRLTNLGSDNEWDSEDDMRLRETEDGQVTFTKLGEDVKFRDDPYGKYQLDVWEDGYCLYTRTFEVTNKLKITEVPENPYAGEEIRVKVIDIDDIGVAGATITVSGSGGTGMVGSYSSDNSGYVRFSLPSVGSYTLYATKKGYEDSSVTVTARDKKFMDVKIEPVKQAIGKDVVIEVTSNGKPIEDASITVGKPDGTKDTLSTSAAGKVVYKPGSPGTYDITVKKDGYETTTSSFTAMNFFSVSMPDELGLYEELTITAEDQNGVKVVDASVELSGSAVRGLTDSAGSFTFILEKAGKYTLLVKKTGYADYSEEVTIYGILNLDVAPTVLDLGDSVTLTVSNEKGDRIEADISIVKPDGRKEDIRKSSHIFTPALAGSYDVTASIDYYKSSTVVFDVNPHPLNLNVWVSGNDLTIKATSRDNPVENVNVSVLTPNGETVSLKTDGEGIARLDIAELNQTGTFTINSVDFNYEKKTVTQEIESLGGGLMPLLLLGISMILLLALVVFFVFYVSHKKSKGKVSKPVKKTKKSRGTGLGSI